MLGGIVKRNRLIQVRPAFRDAWMGRGGAKAGDGERRVDREAGLSLGLCFWKPPETRQSGGQIEMRPWIISIWFRLNGAAKRPSQ